MPSARDEAAPPTMSDVARLAGVSVMTVSNVVNGKDARVSQAMRDRVHEVISELGYRVNMPARALRLGRIGVVALAVPMLDDLYYGEVAQRLADRFEDHGLRLAVESTRGALTRELAVLDDSRLTTYDGVVLAAAAGDASVLEGLQPSTPLVILGERSVPDRFSQVSMDNRGGALRATMDLLRLGARRIALIGGATDGGEGMAAGRTAGHLEALDGAGVARAAELIVPAGVRPQDGYAAAASLLDAGVAFDALLCVTDALALGAMAAVAARGLRIPEDVQVIGWDDTAVGAMATPALSSVAPDNAAAAEVTVRLLMGRIESPSFPPEHVVVSTEVRHRGTTRR
ncbi:LacI family DNA-binding transcriptional regulator [Demequina capsici]|uniref:LacI family DNA-binding transcriptional regulator n=1 Tax=Demequina capsici TaxID=3075620 RepID=A0AA96J6I3_9MICO|nr:LacI family DNA-binding transcriptional regulator [Demequina sp. OYTSA14]WNM24252.1 LacI family DNA-binding transcriptional regulator [Demequina sp. OYTSA14]